MNSETPLLEWAAQINSLGGQGILTRYDIQEFSQAEASIIRLMKDGAWHKASAIILASGQREGLRRLRNLRKKGFQVKRRRDGESRDFLYQLNDQSGATRSD